MLFRRGNILTSLIPVAVIGIFVGTFFWYAGRDPVKKLEERVPGMDDRPKLIGENDTVNIGEFFEITGTVSASVISEEHHNWPRFRGSSFDNISRDPTPIAESWPDTGPPVVWQVKLGEGYAAPVVYNRKVYILDYDEKIRADILRCFSLDDGHELWRRWYNVAIKRNHGMSRSIPTVTDKYIVTIGPKGHVMCLDTGTGDLLWTLDPVRDLGAIIPQWYTAQCPLVDDGIAVIAIGGDMLMLGIDCETGETIWETPNPDAWKMSHSSVIRAVIQNKATYVYMAEGGICGISAEGSDRGKLLWKSSEWSPKVIATTPVYAGNNEIIFTTGYGAGGGRLKIERNGDTFTARVLDVHSPREGMASEQQTPILAGDYIWTINPKDGGAFGKQLACYHRSDLRNPVWTSGKENRFGLGPYLLVGDRFFLVNDDAELFMYRLGRGSLSLLDQFKPLEEGVDAWGPLVFTEGYLLMRDSYNLLCIDLREEQGE